MNKAEDEESTPEPKEKILDREGWTIHEENRCWRFTQKGKRLGQVIIREFLENGNIKVQDMKTLNLGEVRPEMLKLIASKKERTTKELRYDLDRETVRQVSERLSKKRRR